jgi:hypothetical protein
MIELPCNLVIPLWRTYPVGQTDICIPVFSTALFLQPRNGSNLGIHQPMDKQNVVHIQKGYSFIKKSEIISFVTT